MPRRTQTLITGFEAFGKVQSNPTDRIVRALSYTCIEGQEVVGYVLPVSYTYLFDWLRAILEVGGRGGQPFDTLLHLGVALGSPHWRVEELARNECGQAPDGEGKTPLQSWITQAGDFLLSGSLPTEAIVNDLNANNIPTKVSMSAGDYLCNYLYYRSLELVAGMPNPPRVGFLHVPADTETFDSKVMSAPVFPFETHLEAVKSVLTTLGKHPQ